MSKDPSQQKTQGKTQFLVGNLLRGFAWLAILIVAFIWAKNELGGDYIKWLEPIYEKPITMFSIFLASEVMIGIIPPELFMIWASRNDILSDYVGNILLLSGISYLSGIIGHWIGTYLNQSAFFRLMKRNFFGKYERYIAEYGGFIIIVASLTPVPFSGIAMLMGSIRYSFRRYLTFALFRFLRFGVYGFIIWEAHIL